ncbi:MAG: DMT family transporter [Phototrophicaceae bacterium]|jgi:drug/metabolite transporter (DMT)-like permease
MQRLQRSPVLLAYIVLAIGVVCGWFIAPFIRFTQEAGMPSLVIAAGRLIITAICFTPFVLMKDRATLAALTRADWGWCALAGVMIGLHFVTFIFALEYTSILGSIVFSNVTPLFAALLGWWVLRDVPPRGVWIGIGLALVGIVVVALGRTESHPPTRNDPVLGNSLALGSAVFLAIYFMVGKRLRGKMTFLAYSWAVFGIGGLCLLAFIPLTGTSLLGYPTSAYLWLLVVAVIGQMIAHSAYNYALGRLSAVIVSLGLMLLPIGSTLLGIILNGETPSVLSAIGAAILLAGVAAGNLARA